MLLFKIPLDSKQLYCIRLKVTFNINPIIRMLSKVCEYYEVRINAALQNLDNVACFARSSHRCQKYRYNSCSWSTQLQSLHKESAVTAKPECIMKTKINQQNAPINSGLIYYWSITPTCFGPSVEAIIREFEILESYKAIVLIC